MAIFKFCEEIVIQVLEETNSVQVIAINNSIRDAYIKNVSSRNKQPIKSALVYAE